MSHVEHFSPPIGFFPALVVGAGPVVIIEVDLRGFNRLKPLPAAAFAFSQPDIHPLLAIGDKHEDFKAGGQCEVNFRHSLGYHRAARGCGTGSL